MAGLLKAVGGLVIGIAILFGIATLFSGSAAGVAAGLIGALSYAFNGAVIFALGLMLEHLEAIRRECDRQSDMLTDLLRKMPKTDASPREPGVSQLDQLAKSSFKSRDI
ncbi:hypothetical protein Rhsp01_54620 [Rhizobium sp. NBRC 114257]|uniref:Uncharacterized protein n=1 Tax=Rhizobium dioscoreae TaxID=2653122 RepID=A0ABQ0ZBP4_9HYPH|nr:MULTISPECIES: hypothetical protein [Rhizobium]GES52930.1 hypothetical protein RsS93_55440 [Rhizobium dioscoreae]GLU84286.1 hypothetical protein Rhsp01_54620 [Rhizobium sp. NBRC 114257]